MSFLDALQAKRKQLRHCESIVTTSTGERYAENSLTQEIKKLKKQAAFGFVVDTKPDFVPACVIDGFLYLGSQDSVTYENISQYQLTHILSIGIECPLQDLTNNVKNLHVACLDLPESTLTGDVLNKSFKFIEEARSLKGRVLVHCNAGVSRSSSVVIAYLMRYHRMDFDGAFKRVKARRECIQPNSGFLKQLREYQLSDIS